MFKVGKHRIETTTRTSISQNNRNSAILINNGYNFSKPINNKNKTNEEVQIKIGEHIHYFKASGNQNGVLIV